ncbi:MAG: MATE family efflux transporter, partial [Lachnospiraceae bacterium]|nr:MATE family efflux transporter [Lachnospiraceae bacterium]
SSLIMGFAYVLSTKIVSPLGNIAITANSFAITAESLCYMPGYGISHAAVTLVGQMKGAGNKKLEKDFAYMTVITGMIFMALSAVLLYIFAPEMIGIMTEEAEVRELGTRILRIEAFAEPMFGASIVAEGVFRGMGKTRIPTVLNLISMWCVRLPASYFAAGQFGLVGVWYVMCFELCFRGIIFLVSMWKAYRKKNG